MNDVNAPPQQDATRHQVTRRATEIHQRAIADQLLIIIIIITIIIIIIIIKVGGSGVAIL
jgi:hypothetical protein